MYLSHGFLPFCRLRAFGGSHYPPGRFFGIKNAPGPVPSDDRNTGAINNKVPQAKKSALIIE
jgi:hypothetical protein